MTTVETIEFIDSTYGVIVNGFQWGDDESLFDYTLGCSTQTWPTRHEAEVAYYTRKR